MVVTAPFLLLLLDAWPLGRVQLSPPTALARDLARRAAEKAPFFLLAAAACAVTWLAQTSGGGSSALSPIPAWPRIANAIVSYARYPLMAVWPAGLASFYPHPGTVRPDVAILPVVAAAAALVAVSAWTLRDLQRRPYLAWGWLWYLGTLVPVIGFVQVGGQAMADRYTYVPLVGLLVAGVWGVTEAAVRWRLPRGVVAGIAAAVVIALSALAWQQAGHWRDSLTLHTRSLAVTEANWKAWQGLCDALLDAGRLPDAATACQEAVRILPTFPEAWQTLGVVRARMGDPAAAIPLFVRALELRPDYFNALRNLGSAFANLGEYPVAVHWYREAIRLRPDDAEAWSSLGLALLGQGDRAAAVEAERRLRALDPARADALRGRIGP
jgi:tetratricopeptide (TPR) repeat protein